MSYVIAAPEIMTAAATDLATIGSTLDAATAAAALPTLAPAAADEVSASIARLFSQHAQDYQALAAEAAAFQGQFVQKLTASAASYASIEDAIVWLLDTSAGWFLTTLDAGVGLVFGPDVERIVENLPTTIGTFFAIAVIVAILVYAFAYIAIGSLVLEYTGNPFFFAREI
jgi:PE family